MREGEREKSKNRNKVGYENKRWLRWWWVGIKQWINKISTEKFSQKKREMLLIKVRLEVKEKVTKIG